MNRVGARILLVEDQPRLTDAVVKALAAAGIGCDVAHSMGQAAAALKQMPYAALVLDRGLPDGDGLDWLRALRTQGFALPSLVLTARDALHDRVDGLEAGADDYLTKPFAMDELVARVRALLRRPVLWSAPVRSWAGVTVEPESASMATGAGRVSLAPSELQVMLLLIAGQGRTVRRSELEAAAWGLSEAVTPNALDVALHRLRRKLALLRAEATLINTKGVGYAMVGSTAGVGMERPAPGR